MKRVLFVGLAESSHTAGWINLLENSNIDYALFALPTGGLPASKTIPTYMSDHRARRGASGFNLLNLKLSQLVPVFFLRYWFGLVRLSFRILKAVARIFSINVNLRQYPVIPEYLLAYQLKSFMRTFDPHIVHTLGLFPSSNLFLEVAQEFPKVRWVVQARGGPDLELNVLRTHNEERIRRIFSQADIIVCDSDVNYALAHSFGADPIKFKLGVVPGSGGLDFEQYALGLIPPRGERLVVWPKVYEAISSKATPVFEAIKIAWEDIKPVSFVFLWLEDGELELWLKKTLSPEILASVTILRRVSHADALREISRARVLLAPSLMDGIPNVMLESMMFGTVPIVSPIPTISSFVSDPENVIFARNLYPEEIAHALVRALNDEDGNFLRRRANYDLVKAKYDRSSIKLQLNRVYEELFLM
jgi:glycosyltransferase involved in cell wall biosynthesis